MCISEYLAGKIKILSNIFNELLLSFPHLVQAVIAVSIPVDARMEFTYNRGPYDPDGTAGILQIRVKSHIFPNPTI